MAALYLTETDVAELADIQTAIDVVMEAFRQLAVGEAENVPRRRCRAGGAMLHGMGAAAGYLGRLGWKQYVTTRSSARFLFGLHDAASGDLLALLEADRLGQLRTGAATAVAVSCMAAPDATEVGLFGTGLQARTQLAAVAAVRSLSCAFVYGRDPQRREAFAREMSEQLELDVVPVDRPRDAAEDLPMVLTATTSREPVLDGSWLDEGAVVCAIGSNAMSRAEIDAATVRRSDHIVCDSIEACQQEAGDFADALARGDFDWSRAVELAEVVAGRAVGRSHSGGLGLFKSVGLAIEDLALGSVVYDRAQERGIGQKMPA